jgi:hypothetical protein
MSNDHQVNTSLSTGFSSHLQINRPETATLGYTISLHTFIFLSSHVPCSKLTKLHRDIYFPSLFSLLIFFLRSLFSITFSYVVFHKPEAKNDMGDFRFSRQRV